jgi:hypothetical protein
MLNEKKPARVGATKRLLVATALVGALGGNALAQSDAGVAPVPAVVMDAGVAEPPPSTDPEVGSNEDLIARFNDVKKAYENLKDAKQRDDDPTKYAIALLIAAIANLLLSGIKRAMKLTGKAKKILPWAAVVASAVATGAIHFGGGMSLANSLFYGGAVLGAVVLQELGVIPIKSKDA